MKKLLSILTLLLSSTLLQAQENSLSRIQVNDNIVLTQIKDSFFIHTSYYNSEQFGRFPSNGMLVIKNGKALMIDTPMTIEMTEDIIEYLQSSMNVEVIRIIIGHYHDDCLGGLEYLHDKGIESISLDITSQKCREYDLPIPKVEFSNKFNFHFEGEKVIAQYFGGGHTIDNIVVYFPSQEVLFGGCLIKSMASKGLGNTADAEISEWVPTIQKLKKEFKDIDIVIPGHGQYGNKELLDHTIKLVKNYSQQ